MHTDILDLGIGQFLTRSLVCKQFEATHPANVQAYDYTCLCAYARIVACKTMLFALAYYHI